LAQER
ncbi:hypothetical protein D039_5100B, partial [Vibrio parahaemolyticus EKP-028]